MVCKLYLFEKKNITLFSHFLFLTKGIPDIVINDIEQNITGTKTIQNLVLEEPDAVNKIDGLINNMNIEQLRMRSEKPMETIRLDKIYVENMAQFHNGVTFKKINTLTDGQFSRLVEQSLTLDDQWSNLGFDNVYFNELQVNDLECMTINGMDLEKDYLTRSGKQTINVDYRMNDIVLDSSARIDSINNLSLLMLNNVMNNNKNQTVNGRKKIVGNVFLDSININAVNSIPLDDVVFQYNINVDNADKRTIIGSKYFYNELYFDTLMVDDLIIDTINSININNIINHSLRRMKPQNIFNNINFNSMLILKNENFQTPTINGMDLQWLNNDVVLNEINDGRSRQNYPVQNITGTKIFTGPVHFNQIEFYHLFDGITVYEMKNNWLINTREFLQPVWANFSVDRLTVKNLNIHDSTMNQINLNHLFNNVVWLDKKTAIKSNVEFFGNVKINGN